MKAKERWTGQKSKLKAVVVAAYSLEISHFREYISDSDENGAKTNDEIDNTDAKKSKPKKITKTMMIVAEIDKQMKIKRDMSCFCVLVDTDAVAM
ncbi:hypothetical protein AXG93_4303s1040 [Marchantia polymorpha subsp. ruderalis]|uniref:Uncharacterized protein n=1 Tax=Marchantia polymorpha subsp. ruderalis TaxID=1480154 RepID=A0A176WUJ0_MARPO|nr:hypothetical protein AXG93_4303s1040 [Marchantia polymorpha subsp. ruderalis]